MKRTPKAEEIHNSHVTPQLSHFLLIQGWGPLSLFRKGYLDIYKSTVHWNASTPLVLAFVYPRLTNNFKFVSKFTAFRRPHPSLFAFFSALCRWQHHDRQASRLHSWNVWSVESLSAWHCPPSHCNTGRWTAAIERYSCLSCISTCPVCPVIVVSSLSLTIYVIVIKIY